MAFLEQLYISVCIYLTHLNFYLHLRQLNKASIILDATKYIEELKEKVVKLNQEVACAQNIVIEDPLPMVTVETLERGFLINVFSDKSSPGLLVSILEAFEELGLEVMEARASCTDTFRLEAVGAEVSKKSTIPSYV
ncbi:hypothetical protein ACMD2_06221 [Ananas comosus]|uniref:Plant bHLH transcription factor ACT-like domain-containing protein n=1 Tax=Ananas comosus TaxID=4615 RepID=A0A199UPV9_ANACO|nr:hypothetical protein ACMD2_06221 [Ananas comosus]